MTEAETTNIPFEVDGIVYHRPQGNADERSVYIREMFQLVDDVTSCMPGEAPGYVLLRFEDPKLPRRACVRCWVQNKAWGSHDGNFPGIPDHELEAIGDYNERPI